MKISCCLASGTDNQSTDVVLRLIARSRGGCQLGRFANAFCCALRFLLCAGWLLSVRDGWIWAVGSLLLYSHMLVVDLVVVVFGG